MWNFILPEFCNYFCIYFLQFSPNGASLEQTLCFQTELVEFIIDIIYTLSCAEENNTCLNSKGRLHRVILFFLQYSCTLSF